MFEWNYCLLFAFSETCCWCLWVVQVWPVPCMSWEGLKPLSWAQNADGKTEAKLLPCVSLENSCQSARRGRLRVKMIFSLKSYLQDFCRKPQIFYGWPLFGGFFNFWPCRLWKVAILRWFYSWTFFYLTLRLKVNIKKSSTNFFQWITYKMSKRLKFKIWGQLDYPKKSFEDLFFHFQWPLMTSAIFKL